MANTHSKTNVRNLVGLAILATIVVVLQAVASSIPLGTVRISLSLIPIIIGAILYGPIGGAVLGAVFGVVVCIAVVTGADPGGFLMFQYRPFLTLLLCMAKGTVAGLVAGLVNKALAKTRQKLGVVLAAILCPLCNTGIFCIGILTVFRDLADQWAAGAGHTSLIAYVLLALVGVNFIVELAVDLILVPVILRIIRAVKKA